MRGIAHESLLLIQYASRVTSREDKGLVASEYHV